MNKCVVCAFEMVAISGVTTDFNSALALTTDYFRLSDIPFSYCMYFRCTFKQ